MKLFEGGILDKITNDEYEKMFQSMPAMNAQEEDADDDDNSERVAEEQGKVDTKINGRGDAHAKAKPNEKELTALNLRMLQGAFYVICMGHALACGVLILEIECRRPSCQFVSRLRKCSLAFCQSLLLQATKRIAEIKMWIYQNVTTN